MITGKRDTISPPVNEAMYVSSLAHVLSISGYHMAVVAGIVFFIFRASLALIPSIASRYSIKKWAALPALAAAAFYLVLSGAEVATQRSFIMVAVVLIGVMCDRPALTLRTLTIAALIVLALAPEAVVHPGFQMSFAATLALVAAYAHGLPWGADADSSLSARMALWGGRQIVGLILASLVAGLATTLYAAFHFHRLAPYGVLANLLAMPVVSLGVMPAGILGGVLMPFGFDAPFWRLMGLGIDWMIFIAEWVASLPGRGRTHCGVWNRPALAGDGRASPDLPAANAVALERCGSGCGRHPVGRHDRTAEYLRRLRWPRRRGTRRQWQAERDDQRPRHVCPARVAVRPTPIRASRMIPA